MPPYQGLSVSSFALVAQARTIGQVDNGVLGQVEEGCIHKSDNLSEVNEDSAIHHDPFPLWSLGSWAEQRAKEYAIMLFAS
ncbi:hypothetical protein ColTof3_07587 [Colletotrichum tofieldiae]|nr:hypothetical protein ColTof3_07587 [Colletotrichum tofieldiae]